MSGRAFSTDDACAGTLIDQLTLSSGQAEQPLGWESVVQATLRSKLDTVVVRDSRERLLIQLPQLLVYKLSEAETALSNEKARGSAAAKKLITDLEALRRTDPVMHAVVFTHYLEVQAAVVASGRLAQVRQARAG